jgi:deazaflavin-dependent oxidoreductase (nitroreductase family)
VPLSVKLFGPILRLLLTLGLPLGFNRLVTIRGRRTGLPRTAALAVITVSGRRWVWAPWGEVQWVRNLRAAGRATIRERGRTAEFRATELDGAERLTFFRDVLGPLARSFPFGVWFIRLVEDVDLNHPVEVAKDRRAFELHAVIE